MSDILAAISTIDISWRWTHLGMQNQVLISQRNVGRQTSLRKKQRPYDLSRQSYWEDYLPVKISHHRKPKNIQIQFKMVISCAFYKMASKVLNPLYLLPLCRFSLCHDTVTPLVLVQTGESVYLPAHTPVHWLALLDLAYKKALKASLPSILMSAGTNKRNPVHKSHLLWLSPLAGLDPLRHLSAGSRRDTSFGEETLFPRNLQRASETKRSWPAPGCGAKWILATLHLTDTDKE